MIKGGTSHTYKQLHIINNDQRTYKPHMQEDHARRSRTRQIAIPLSCVAGLDHTVEADKDYTLSRQYCFYVT
jgi:hypothetical protein